MSRSVTGSVPKPNFHEEAWRSFDHARAENSALARKHWPEYRRGLTQVERRFRRILPVSILHRELTLDAISCAIHWKHSRAIVRAALRNFLAIQQGANDFVFTAVDYFLWVKEQSPQDLTEAGQLLAKAREVISLAEPLSQRNLRRMIAVRIDGERLVS